MSESNTALQSFVDRLVSLHKEKKQTMDIIKDLKSEAKSNGFDPAALDELVKRILASEEALKKNKDKSDLAKVYANAIGRISLFD